MSTLPLFGNEPVERAAPGSNNAVQFSGGRTSAYMLHTLLDEIRSGAATWKVCFENTGKEREETLEFIEEISLRWSVPVTWIEYDDYFDEKDYVKPDGTIVSNKLNEGTRYRVVDFRSASRKGEPFEKLIEKYARYRKFVKDKPPILPNPTQRICTSQLKIAVSRCYLLDLGWEDWNLYMGIRKDEAHRRARMLDRVPSYQTLRTPLITANVSKQDVSRFWSAQPFDLRLDANSDEGNCDLCFLKATSKLVKIMRADRTREKWWIEMERRTGTDFGRNRPSFTQIASMIDSDDARLKALESSTDKTLDCFCGE